MAGESGSVGVGDDLGASSPRNKVKFLCSHGGKILPRPIDGILKYVGGETRVIAVHRDITFSELMKKLTALTDGDMILKYQLVAEDLDALVSVRSDEDIKHMFDECDRHVNGAPMLRAFLFPSKVVVSENHAAAVSEPHNMLEQRYIDAINGIQSPGPVARQGSTRAVSASSACSSPKSNSPDGHSHTVDVVNESPFFSGSRAGRVSMQRVRSSPSITSLSNLQNHSNGYSSLGSPQYNNSYYHQHHAHGHPSVRVPPDPHAGVWSGRPPPILSLGKPEIGRGNGLNHYYPTSSSRHNSHMGSGGCSMYGYHDECPPSAHIRFERANSAPRPPSPRQTIWE